MLARMTLATLALAAITLIGPYKTSAAPYWPWCAQSFNQDTTHSCAFISREQCMETLRGIGGYCYTNPYGPPPATAAKSSRRAARH
jgi:hypothetical protein